MRSQFNTKEELRCLCGSAKCRGFLGVDVAAAKAQELENAGSGGGAGSGNRRGTKRQRTEPTQLATLSKKARRRLLKESAKMVRLHGITPPMPHSTAAGLSSPRACVCVRRKSERCCSSAKTS